MRAWVSVLASAASVSLIACGGNAPQADEETVAAVLRDVPQRNASLGREDAAAVATLFADPLCVGEGCEDVTGSTLHTVIRRFVRPGRLRLVLRPVATPDFEPYALRETLAAGMQDRLWTYVMLGWSSRDPGADPLAVAKITPGLDVARLREDAGSRRTAAAVERAQERRQRRGASVPSLWFDPPGLGGSNVREVALTDKGTAVREIERLLSPRASYDVVRNSR